MSTHILENKTDLGRLFTLLNNRDFPMTVNVKKGKDRTEEQNRLQHLWMTEAATQGDSTSEQYRGFCKLHFGVPILRNEDEYFRIEYDEVIRPLPYEKKLKLMMIPFDFSVTRLMTTGQFTRYLKDVHEHFTSKGMTLTDPESES